MGMFKAAVDAGVKAAAINVQEELAKHRANPTGAVKDNLEAQESAGRWGGGALGLLGGGLLGTVGGAALSGGNPGAALAGGLGAGGLGAYLGGRMGADRGRRLHEEELSRILASPQLARDDVNKTFTPKTLLGAGLGGLTGGLTGYYGGGSFNQIANAAGRPMDPRLAAGLGAVSGAALPIMARMEDQDRRKALVDQLVGLQAPAAP